MTTAGPRIDLGAILLNLNLLEKCWQILSENVAGFRELLQILQEHVWRIVPQLARFWQIFLDFPPKFQPTRCHSFGGAELLQILARLHTGWGNGKQ